MGKLYFIICEDGRVVNALETPCHDSLDWIGRPSCPVIDMLLVIVTWVG